LANVFDTAEEAGELDALAKQLLEEKLHEIQTAKKGKTGE
jgi:hypothetical protein